MEAELPPGRLSWQLAPARAARLVHDMQHYFVAVFPPGVAPIAEVVANIARIRQRCDELGVPVFYSAQPGQQDPAERERQSDFWGPGMTSAPGHQAIVDALSLAPAHTVLTKWRYSAFQRTALEDQLRRPRPRSAHRDRRLREHRCVLTAADAFMRDVQPFFAADAVADVSRAARPGRDLRGGPVRAADDDRPGAGRVVSVTFFEPKIDT